MDLYYFKALLLSFICFTPPHAFLCLYSLTTFVTRMYMHLHFAAAHRPHLLIYFRFCLPCHFHLGYVVLNSTFASLTLQREREKERKCLISYLLSSYLSVYLPLPFCLTGDKRGRQTQTTYHHLDIYKHVYHQLYGMNDVIEADMQLKTFFFY